MKSYFRIYQTCTSDNIRPPISYKIREYFERFLTDNVLEKNKIIVDGKWNISLSLLFVDGGSRHTLREVYMAKGARTISSEKMKIYEILLPLTIIQEAEDPQLRTIELMYEAITVFLTSSYKKITVEFMNMLRDKIDMQYLLSLPYPAPFEEQKYLLDEQLFSKQPDGTMRRTTPEEQAQSVGYKGRLK